MKNLHRTHRGVPIRRQSVWRNNKDYSVFRVWGKDGEGINYAIKYLTEPIDETAVKTLAYMDDSMPLECPVLGDVRFWEVSVAMEDTVGKLMPTHVELWSVLSDDWIKPTTTCYVAGTLYRVPESAGWTFDDEETCRKCVNLRTPKCDECVDYNNFEDDHITPGPHAEGCGCDACITNRNFKLSVEAGFDEIEKELMEEDKQRDPMDLVGIESSLDDMVHELSSWPSLKDEWTQFRSALDNLQAKIQDKYQEVADKIWPPTKKDLEDRVDKAETLGKDKPDDLESGIEQMRRESDKKAEKTLVAVEDAHERAADSKLTFEIEKIRENMEECIKGYIGDTVSEETVEKLEDSMLKALSEHLRTVKGAEDPYRFLMTYRCTNCSHIWSNVHVREGSEKCADCGQPDVAPYVVTDSAEVVRFPEAPKGDAVLTEGDAVLTEGDAFTHKPTNFPQDLIVNEFGGQSKRLAESINAIHAYLRSIR